MIGSAPISDITGVPGWETPDEQNYLVELARQVPDDGLIVEIGGEFGQSASLFARGAADQVRIVTIDKFPGDLLDQHRQNLDEAGYGGRTEQITGDSQVAVETWDGDINLLFIDGDHSYEGAKADLDAWTPYLALDGVLVVHDVAQPTNLTPHPLHHEVARALRDWLAGQGGAWESLEAVNTIAAFRRKTRPPEGGDEEGEDPQESDESDDKPEPKKKAASKGKR